MENVNEGWRDRGRLEGEELGEEWRETRWEEASILVRKGVEPCGRSGWCSVVLAR